MSKNLNLLFYATYLFAVNKWVHLGMYFDLTRIHSFVYSLNSGVHRRLILPIPKSERTLHREKLQSTWNEQETILFVLIEKASKGFKRLQDIADKEYDSVSHSDGYLSLWLSLSF